MGESESKCIATFYFNFHIPLVQREKVLRALLLTAHGALRPR